MGILNAIGNALKAVGRGIVFTIQRRPLYVIALVDTCLTAGVTFGLPITPQEKLAADAIMQALAVLLAQSQVTPNVTVTKLVATALATTPTSQPAP